tara:strand:+ start:422 stop:625 length:204 start_codon:yes stop_codon:yes gene_type:complete
MSKGFEKGMFDVEVEMPHEEIRKLIKNYKKMKKYSKSSMHEIEKLSGKKTKIEKLIEEHGDVDNPSK